MRRATLVILRFLVGRQTLDDRRDVVGRQQTALGDLPDELLPSDSPGDTPKGRHGDRNRYFYAR
jgi:hypothetical protein